MMNSVGDAKESPGRVRMRNRIETDHSGSDHSTEGRLLWFALLPLFAVAEGTHRMIFGPPRQGALTGRRDWLTEAKTQASIATSYVLMARSWLH